LRSHRSVVATELVPVRGQRDLERPPKRAKEGLLRCLIREQDEQRIVGEQQAVAPDHDVDPVADSGQPVLPAQFVHRRGNVTKRRGH
jgi:hypothetical protein